MINYYHVYNTTDITKPSSIHIIDAGLSTANIALYVNGTFIKYIAPNAHSNGSMTFTKKFSHGYNVLENLHSGTIATYTDQAIDSAIFNNNTYIYVKNTQGKYLYRTVGTTDHYEWHSTLRSKFFFNPYFWDSEYLWTQLFGYVPSGIKLTKQWPQLDELSLFSKRTLVVPDTWVGSAVINTILPTTIDYFTNPGSGTTITYKVNSIIDMDLNIGDTVTLINGIDTLTFTYNPLNLSSVKINGITMPATVNITSHTRPVIHIPVVTTQPNKNILFTKNLANGVNNFNITINGTNYPVSVTTSASPADLVMSDLVSIYDPAYEHIVQ